MGRRTSLVSHPWGGRDRPEPQTPDTSVVKQKNHDRQHPVLQAYNLRSPARHEREVLQQYNLPISQSVHHLKVTPTKKEQ